MSAFLSNATALRAIMRSESTLTRVANDNVGFPDDPAGYVVLGSRLIPETAYLRNSSSVGVACKQLLSQGIKSILGLLVTGGM